MKQPSEYERYREEMEEIENQQIYAIEEYYEIALRERIEAVLKLYKYKRSKPLDQDERDNLTQLFSYFIDVIEDYLLEQQSQKAQEKLGAMSK